MGKKLSAAQKQQISATLKRKWAERKALAAPQDKATARIEPFKLHEPVKAAPRSSKDGREQVAADVVALLDEEISNLLLVRVIDRILRP